MNYSNTAASAQAALLAANLQVLQQGADLLRHIDDEQYTLTARPLFSYGVGSHLRHCLDFYQSFLAGIAQGRVDYDARERDERTAQARDFALARLARLTMSLPECLADTPVALRVRQDGLPWAVSSVERELQFLLSHTVHHFALIALILRLQGVEPGPEFGVAPATLEYWNR